MPYKIELKDAPYLGQITTKNFDAIALSVFRHQYWGNPIYRNFVDALRVIPEQVNSTSAIPFLPISFFKTHTVITGDAQPEIVFESSKTTGDTPSRHLVTDASLYRNALLRGFEEFYGSPKDYTILALLPSYLERSNASLVYMAKVLMQESGHSLNGFYLDEWEKLHATMQELENQQQKIILLGVTFALLDFAAAYPMHLKNTIVMETGGMKGRKEEWTRIQVHDFLKQQWQLGVVHSEYGMTELLSQAYATANGIFRPTSTMKVFVRDINDPFEIKDRGAGCLNIIDLANLNSCAFIATDDIGTIYPDGSFEVLGRVDHSALRGCNLMVV